MLIILIIIMIFSCCGIISSSISSGAAFGGDFEGMFGDSETSGSYWMSGDSSTIGSYWMSGDSETSGASGTSSASGELQEGHPSTFCKVILNQGSCDDKGEQSMQLIANRDNNLRVDIGDGELPNWGSQDGDSFDIKGNCSNLRISDSDGATYRRPSHFSTNYECINFSSDLQDDLILVEFEMGSELSEAEFAEMESIEPCVLKMNQGLCDDKGEQSVEMIAMPNDGVVRFNLSNINGQRTLSGWGDEDGDSVDIKGPCKNILIKDALRPTGPHFELDQHSGFQCYNLTHNPYTQASIDVDDDVGEVSFEHGEPTPADPSAPPPPRIPCQVKLKYDDCGTDGAESQPIGDGTFDIETENDNPPFGTGNYSWDKDWTESFLYYGDCEYIHVTDVDSSETVTISNDYDGTRANPKCVNTATLGSIEDDVKFLTIKTALPLTPPDMQVVLVNKHPNHSQGVPGTACENNKTLEQCRDICKSNSPCTHVWWAKHPTSALEGRCCPKHNVTNITDNRTAVGGTFYEVLS